VHYATIAFYTLRGEEAAVSAATGRSSGGAQDVDDVVSAVLTASRVLVAVSAESLAAVQETVTVTQFRTLVVLQTHGVINQKWLAEQLSIAPSTAVRMVDKLEAAGLLTRQDNPADRREVQLRLTRQGARLVNEVTERRRRAIKRIVTRLPADSRTELVTVLAEFSEAAGEPRAPGGVTAYGW
jgi:DNA-binding MarR family transcriptional regulator